MKKFLLTILISILVLPVLPVRASVEYATVFNPDTGDRKVVEVGSPTAFNDGYLLEVARAVEVPKDMLGFSVVTDYAKNLSASINASQATIPVTSMTTKDEHVLTMADLGSKVFLVIEAGRRKEEIVMCTGISGTNWTGCTRGLAFYGTSTAAVTANQMTHNSGSNIIISNTHYIYDEIVDKDSDETIAGIKTFSSSPLVPSPSLAGQAANKAYVDGVAQQGGATSTLTVEGISQLATQAEMAGTIFASNTPAVISTKFSTSSPDVVGSYAIISDDDNQLNSEFLRQGDDWIRTGDTTFASTTFNASTTWNILPEYDSDPVGDNEATRKSYVDTKAPNTSIKASDDIPYTEANTERSTALTSYYKVKEILINKAGTYNTTFQLKCNTSTGNSYGRIYKDGVGFGTERSTSNTSYQTYTEELTFSQGDLIQLYIYHDNGGTSAVIQNFQLLATLQIENTVNIN